MSLPDIAFPLRLSLQVALTATALSAVFGVAAAYLLARREFPGRGFVDALVMLPMVLPPVVTGYYLLLLVGRHGALASLVGGDPGITFTWWAAVLASFVVSVPFTVKSARAAFESADPAIIAASYTLGRGELDTFWHVTLPLARRGIVAGLVLSFARALGEFGATIMVAGNIDGRTNTMALEIYNAVVFGDWRTAGVLVAVFTATSLAFIAIAGRLGKVA
ncbi:MAG: molybdate ABC transporter permease subunit [Coriobacteriia bacterium]